VAKKTAPQTPTIFQRLHGLLKFSSGTRTVLLMAVLAALFVGGAVYAWHLVRGRVLASTDYAVGPGQIEVPPMPDWIHKTDIVGDVYRELSREKKLSILDDDLASRTSAAFGRHPWVAHVKEVRKLPSGRLKVELIYRRPVCMVAVAGLAAPIPVDAEARILPLGGFSPVEIAKYPRLIGVDQGPAGTVGDRWGDSRVVGGAEIGEALLPVWEKMKLRSIEPYAPAENGLAGRMPPAARGRLGEYHFVVRSQSGLQILWGPSPALNAPGEPARERKVQKLEQFFAEHGSLDVPQGPKTLDLRLP
jgi:hypothetical protein